MTGWVVSNTSRLGMQCSDRHQRSTRPRRPFVRIPLVLPAGLSYADGSCFSAPLSPTQPLNLSLLDPLLSIAVIPELYVLSLSVSSSLLTAVCALPECCLHVSSRCLLISSDPLRSQPINRRQPSISQPHVVSLSLSVSFVNVVCALPDRCLRISSRCLRTSIPH